MLEGNKIYLRTLEPFDADILLAWENNSENWRVSNTKVPFSRHIIEQYVNSAQDLLTVRQIRLMICLVDTHKPIGTIDLFEYEPFHQRAGVGILIDKAFRNQGYASEAINLAADYAFNGVGLRNLYCSVLANNEASIKLFKKCGFEEVGCKKNWFNNGDEWLDEYTYQKILTN